CCHGIGALPSGTLIKPPEPKMTRARSSPDAYVAALLKQIKSPAAHRLGRALAYRARPLRPSHDTRNAEVVQLHHGLVRFVTRKPPDNMLTQIQ
ncbi:hypothetical protein ABIC09_002923, partial [Bradyrhizobium sp. S3.12.5]|uniref:hypothetical protein n=1 Tax=Bradyrhizobium sp. S3.12.5 TaxID=3156386 RepID=UPI00339851E2